MPAAYLHGVEILPVKKGVRPVNVVRSSVIGLVGIAPKGTTNALTLCLSDTDYAQFGSELPGFTIPQALAAIKAHTTAAVLVVNVFDPATHTTAVTAEAHALAGGKLSLSFCPIDPTAVVVKDSGGVAIVAVFGTDYTIDDFGKFTALTSTFANGTTYKFDYTKLNAGSVASSDIIGSVSGGGTRTGMKAWQPSYAMFGFKPKILIAPGFSSVNAIRVAMETEADYYRGMYYADAPVGTTVSNAITGRGASGSINFNTSSYRGVLLHPMVKAYDTYTNANQVRPYSAYMAGLTALVDLEEGYHVSPSNHALKGVTGLEFPITYDPTDQTGNTEANLLNASGIVTLANSFGTGIKAYGNRSAAFPANTDAEQFIPVKRTRDVIEDSLQLAMVPFLDAPITRPQIDSVVETGNQFLRTLIGRGAVIDGSDVTFDPSVNSDVDLTAGKVTFSLNFMTPTPGERFTVLSTLDVSLLRSLLKAA